MKVIGGVLLLIALLAIRSAINNGVPAAGTAPKANPSAYRTSNPSQCLVLEGATTSIQDGETYIVGSIRNQCDRDYIDVTAVFQLDPPMSGPMSNSHGSYAQAYCRNIKPYEERRFKSVMPVPSDALFHLQSLRGF